MAYFQGRTISFRECITWKKNIKKRLATRSPHRKNGQKTQKCLDLLFSFGEICTIQTITTSRKTNLGLESWYKNERWNKWMHLRSKDVCLIHPKSFSYPKHLGQNWFVLNEPLFSSTILSKNFSQKKKKSCSLKKNSSPNGSRHLV